MGGVKRRHCCRHWKKMKSRCHCDNGAFYFFNADCRPAGDDARTGAAHNPRKLKRAARRACCFCALPLRLKQAWSQVLGTKKPQAFAWGFLWVWRSEADLCISEIKCSFLACYRLFFGKIGALVLRKQVFGRYCGSFCGEA